LQKIFVGDVQGCADELEILIARAEAAFGEEFELWIAGDLVNRGPYNLRVLELVRERVDSGRAQIVLGNHDIFLIAVALGVWNLRPTDSIQDVLDHADVDEWIDWLRMRPLAVSGEIAGQAFVMVHAATHPEWTLETSLTKAASISAKLAGSRDEARDFLASELADGSVRDNLGRLTRCRSVTATGGWSSQEPASATEPWHVAWTRHRHDYGLVYGHWARQGLHFAPGLRGLDTGCVHHGRGRDGFLTAWLPDSSTPRDFDLGGPFDVPDDRIWQIPARRSYYRTD